MSVTDLNSKEDFQKAIDTQGKYVFILAYSGEAPAKAEEMAAKNPNVDAYKFDVSKAPKAQEAHGIDKTPCALVYKDGKRVAKADGMDPTVMADIAKTLSAA